MTPDTLTSVRSGMALAFYGAVVGAALGSMVGVVVHTLASSLAPDRPRARRM